MADISYLNALQFPDSEMSVNAKIAKELNKPVILVIDRSLPHEGKLWIKRFFSGYNVIKEIECDLGDKSQWLAAKDEISKLTMDVMDNKVLSRSDFIRIDLDPMHYYYDNEKKVEPGVCTNSDGYLESEEAMFGERREDTWKQALEIANDLYGRIVIPDCKKHAVKFINDIFKNEDAGD